MIDELQLRRAKAHADAIRADKGPPPVSWLWCRSCGWVSPSTRAVDASPLDLACECGVGLCVTPFRGTP